jgi:molybdopterin converting factor subunit 1
MEVTVRLFATLRQEAGWSQKGVVVPEGSTVHDLLAHLDDQEDGVRTSGRPVYAAVNREYAKPERVLEAGDEVAIFPPVSGGASR